MSAMHEMDNGQITVVIPTLGEAARQVSLSRAISSLLCQEGGAPKIVVLVNGNRFDQSVVRSLLQCADVQVLREPIGSLPNALWIGRKAVQTEYFGFLDDDDEYLPSTLQSRLRVMVENPWVDLVVTQGWREHGGTDIPAFDTKAGEINADPLRALAKGNWLASCGGLYRSTRVGVEMFAQRVGHLEWTYLAYRLSSGHRVYAIDEPGFRIYNSEQSLSKSTSYLRGIAGALNKVLELPLPISVRRQVLRRLGQSHHDLSSHLLDHGALQEAWRAHFLSLRAPGGWRYLSYTRRLLIGK